MTVLGVYLRGSVYADTALPFRLRSAPKLFFTLADIRHVGHQVRAQVLKLSTTGSPRSSHRTHPWKSIWKKLNSGGCWAHQYRNLYMGCYQTSFASGTGDEKRHHAQTEESCCHQQQTRMVSRTLLVNDTYTDLPWHGTMPAFGAGHDSRQAWGGLPFFLHSFS